MHQGIIDLDAGSAAAVYQVSCPAGPATPGGELRTGRITGKKKIGMVRPELDLELNFCIVACSRDRM
jgi:hypothetical protein